MSIVKGFENAKTILTTVAFALSILAGAIIWAVTLQTDVASHETRVSELEAKHKEDSQLGRKIDALRAALERKQSAQ